jgi:type I restriction enzyme S subunit
MTLDTFFEKFDQFADAPDAVAKMRELVLELAVQGKLVAPSPSPDNHPAWIAFRKELSERTYSYDPGPPPPFEIPDHWEWCVLDEVADCRAAAKVSPASIADTDWVLDLEDIDGTKGQIIQTATFAERRSLSTKAAFETGDVLYGKLRPYLNKVVVASKPGFCTTEIIPLRPAAFLSPEFLRYYLRSQTFLRYAAQKNYGMKMPRLGTKDLESAEIPIPPTSEQKRIVAKVDELMDLCDRLEAQQQERDTQHADLARASLARFAEAPPPENLQFIFHKSYDIPPADLRKSILTLAVQGKLVPQDSKDEPAEELLSRNDERRCEAARRDHRADEDNQPLLSGDDRWDIADTWSWRALTDLVLFVDYRGKTPAKLSSGVRLLTAKNVRKGQINLSPEEFLSESEYHAWMTRGFPKAGDILFTTEAPMGNAAVVVLAERFALAQRVICFQSYGAIDPDFLVLQILSDQFQFILDKNGTGVTAKGIKASKLKRLPIAVPPLAEQRRIVAKVDQLTALVDELETQLATSRATAANLLSALVGELTGTVPSGKVSASTSTGRRGRPKKS